MDDPFGIARQLMYGLLFAGGATFLWSIAQSVMEAKGKRFSPHTWLFGPVTLLTLGLLSVAQAMNVIAVSTSDVPLDGRETFVAQGLSRLMNAGTFAGIMLIVTGIVAIIGLGVSRHIRREERSDAMKTRGWNIAVGGVATAILCSVVGFLAGDTAPADFFPALGLTLAVPAHGLTVANSDSASDATESLQTRVVSVSLLALTVIGGIVITAGVTSIQIFKVVGDIAVSERAALLRETISTFYPALIVASGTVAAIPVLAYASFARGEFSSLVRAAKSSATTIALFVLPILLAAGYTGWCYPSFRAQVVETTTANATSADGG